MANPTPAPCIELRGVRHNNLKGFDLDLPLHRLIVVTGLSGSGKSSLAFDTLYAEGQRRYIETFSPYARQFFDRMDKPRVDRISGIPPAIAIEQRNAVRSTRSTVGTMTEICDYMKLLWPHIAQLHCRQCGKSVRKEPPQAIWETALKSGKWEGEKAETQLEHATRNTEVLITFNVPLSEKLPLAESLALIAKQGYQRLLVNNEAVRLDTAEPLLTHHATRNTHLTVIQDRVKLTPASRARFIEACEQAYHFGKGKLAVHELEVSGHATRNTQQFSASSHCPACDITYRDPSPALFSFNHPLGACPACKGFGRTIAIDYDLAIPDRSLTLTEGAVRPWRTGVSTECQQDMTKFCKLRKIPMDVPLSKMSAAHQDWVLNGDPGYGTDKEHEWPRAWYGVKGYFRWLESKSYKMHVRVLLSRYRSYNTCAACNGARLNPDALLYRCPIYDLRLTIYDLKPGASPPEKSSIVNHQSSITLADFYTLSIRDALTLLAALPSSRNTQHATRDPIVLALHQVRSRLQYLANVGLSYLTLDRPTRTLSGGETERVNLTTCLGTKLVNTLYVLDEPSVGLHPRDTERLIGLLEQLRDHGNTVIVVEHEASVMRAADQIVDLGPGHGATGGELVFQGAFKEILKSKTSLTGQYLSGRRRIETPGRRSVGVLESSSADSGSTIPPNTPSLQHSVPHPFLRLTGASAHNLRNLTIAIPLNRFVAITGVSGSGKTTLVRDVLIPALEANLKSEIPDLKSPAKAADGIETETASEEDTQHATRNTAQLSGHEHLNRVLMVDQSALGKTPRSNPAVYTGAFEFIREVFAQSEVAKQRGLNASAFSFNSAVGQCERCRGAGFEKIEMQFLSDVFIRCPDCNGRRYRAHILEVKVTSDGWRVTGSEKSRNTQHATRSFSIADTLEASVDEAVEFFASLTDSKPAQRAVVALKLLQDVGLGYLSLGQPINTLSGGESQRLKLAAHLAEDATRNTQHAATLFIFDEPTTGLHFDDVRVLLLVFQRLVDAGHSVLVIEHNLDVIKCADWVIDLGPEAGADGGQLVATGTPEDIAKCDASHTGQFLRTLTSDDVSDLTLKSGKQKTENRKSNQSLLTSSPVNRRRES